MLPPNTVLHHHYRIEGQIGQGAMSTVYQARDSRDGSLVAIKRVADGDARLRGALDREARILTSLHHPALPQAREYFADGSAWCLVMDFIPGDDLANALQRSNAPPLADVLDWANQLLDVLSYLHGQPTPVIHRDIKPRNLKLTAQGDVVLLDFGLSKGAAGTRADDASLFGYTLAYAPLEQIRGQPTGPRSDLYALAATLYDLLTGAPPPSAVQRAAALLDRLPDPLRPAHALNPQVAPSLSAVLHSALAIDPTQRPASAATMRLALHAAGDPQMTVLGTALPVMARPPEPRPFDMAQGSRREGPNRLNNLPAAPTPLVGRSTQLAALGDLLRRPDVRLVSLTGPAGIGKTRLALQAAEQLLHDVADGVFFVPLAAIGDSRLVATTIAAALGIKERAGQPLVETLKSYLREKELLLLLDNFEQVLDAALLVAALLAAAPGLKILITSRELLRLCGEHEYPVPPLELPSQEPRTTNHEPHANDQDPVLGRVPSGWFSVLSSGADLLHYGAIELFVRCAQAARLGFALNALNAPAVVAICHRLDGLPLAIELAAAWIKTLTPTDLLIRLERRLDLLIEGPRDLPVRQQTLRSAIGWSYGLLEAEERTLFARLGTFVGGWTVEAAKAICGDWRLEIRNYQSQSLISNLQSLVGKSLLRQDSGLVGEPRFSMLESIREYALEQLAAGGEQEALRRRHSDYFLMLAEQIEPKLRGPEQKRWLDVLEIEHDNMRAAQTWALDRQLIEPALRLGGALGSFWRSRGYLDEGRQQLHAALALGNTAATPIRAKALAQLGKIYFHQSNLIDARACYAQSLALYRDLGDQNGVAWMLLDLGCLEQEYAPAHASLIESLALFRSVDDRAGMAAALDQLSDYERWGGDLMMARAYGSESLAQYRELGDRIGIADALRTLGGIAMTQCDMPTARAYLSESAALFEALGEQHGWAWALYDLSRVLAFESDIPTARTSFARSRALFRTLGDQAGLAWSLYGQGEAELYVENATARAWLADGLALFRAIGEDRGIAWSLTRLGKLACDHAELELARACFQEGLALHRQAGNQQGIAYILEGCAGLALARFQPERAAQLCGGAAAMRAAIGTPPRPIEHIAHERLIAGIRTQLDDSAFAIAWADGQVVSVDLLGTYALEEP